MVNGRHVFRQVLIQLDNISFAILERIFNGLVKSNSSESEGDFLLIWVTDRG